MQMNITCGNCEKTFDMTLEHKLNSLSAELAEAVSGIRPHQFYGAVNCLCGYETSIMMTAVCTKID